MRMDNAPLSPGPKALSPKQQTLFMIAPVVLYSLIEEWGGLRWALVLSVVYAIGELLWEWFRYRKLSGLTLFANLMVVGLSMVSYLTEEGFWFKLQPALLEVVFGGMLIGSWLLKKPMLLIMIQEQQSRRQVFQASASVSQGEGNVAVLPEPMTQFFGGLTLRLGIFFLFQAALAYQAALYWSTEAWGFLKTFGVLIMMVIYMGAEVLFMRYRMRAKLNRKQ